MSIEAFPCSQCGAMLVNLDKTLGGVCNDCRLQKAYDELEEIEKRREQEETTIIQEAARLIDGPRQASYGKPEKNFEVVTRMWNAYLKAKGMDLYVITPYDVCMMMVLLKVARCGHAYHRDHAVDIAGYARLAEILSE